MALTQLGQLLGAANGISLERSDEGLAFLQRAFDTADELERTPVEIAADLKVDALLTGSIAKSRDSHRESLPYSPDRGARQLE
jgi:hypothetical protein